MEYIPDDPRVRNGELYGYPEKPTLIGYCRSCKEPLFGEDYDYCQSECFEWEEGLYCEDCFDEMFDKLKEECRKKA